MRRSTFFILLFMVLWVAGTVFVAAGVYNAVSSDGAIEVRVAGPDGRLRVGVPAFFAVRALRSANWTTCAAGRSWGSQDLDDWGPALRAALTELDAYDDVPLLEVEEGGSIVRMHKHGGRFVLELDEGHESVKVIMPVRTVKRVLAEAGV
ncbi:MAG TPA: hypothetical protein VFV54_11495 [Thermoanaerobaculia bacterium]|nr:hypothetical protein [Thermoanaerobaculia bacterium]